jgi:hypothetical protein
MQVGGVCVAYGGTGTGHLSVHVWLPGEGGGNLDKHGKFLCFDFLLGARV